MGFRGYILRSDRSGRYYVGQTEEIQNKVKEHNNGEVRATKPWRPWTLLFERRFATRSEAVRWERRVKRRKSRAFIEQLIEEFNSERGAAR